MDVLNRKTDSASSISTIVASIEHSACYAVRTDEKRKANAGERGKIQSMYYVFYSYSSQGLEF